MSDQYRTVYEADGRWWISKPNNGGELLPVDVENADHLVTHWKEIGEPTP